MTSANFPRRRFLSLTGMVAIGFTMASAASKLGISSAAASTGAALGGNEGDLRVNDSGVADSWLVIGSDNSITIYSGKVELGTGVQTALSQIVCEELHVSVPRVSFVQGDTSLTPDQGYTAGSQTILTAGPVLRVAAATVFQALLAMASKAIGVPELVLRAQGGSIGVGHNLNRALTYGQLIGEQQIELTTNPKVAVVNPSDYQVVGQPTARVDLPAKFLAQFEYVQNVVVPGMLHARVVRPSGTTADGRPVALRNATLDSVDSTKAEAVPGYVQTVQKDNFVAVVATDEWAAIQAAQALAVTWRTGAPLIAQASLPEALQDPANLYQSGTQVDIGDVDTALAGAATQLAASYFTPFQMHGAIGPSCGVADVRAEPDPATGIQVTVWSGTQGVYELQGAIAQMLNIPLTAVHVLYVEAAGCYGHNGADDAAADAAFLSSVVGSPVRVQWMRPDEEGWEPLGPSMAHSMRGGLDSKGNVVAWDHAIYTPTHNSRPDSIAGNLLVGQLLGFLPEPLPASPTNTGTRNGPVNYNFASNRLTENQVRSFVTVPGTTTPAAPLTWLLPRSSALRSLGGLSNSFANESFMDEMASAAHADPLAFRLDYVSGDPRATAVLRAMAKQAGWEKGISNPGPGRGRGISYLRYENNLTYVAAYAEVDVDTTTGVVQVTRVVVAHDCGLIINPDGLRNQIEGNVIQATSRTLMEEVQFDQGGVTSLYWDTSTFHPGTQYPILRFDQVPSVEIVLIDRPSQPAWGAGEPVTEAMPGAIGNAIFNATSVRMRTLPFTPERVLAALSAAR
jgi:CO/xanthine dehydrogenase Mo-binding subunit